MTVNTLGSDSRQIGDSLAANKPRDSRTVAEWLWPLLTGGVALFAISALIYYRIHCDEIKPTSLLQVTIAGIYDVFGLAPSVVFFLMVFAWSSIWAVTGILERPLARLTRLVIMALMLGVFFNLGNGGVAADAHTGALGAWVAGRLVVGVGYVASIVLVWPTMFASVMLATDWFFTEWFERDRKTTDFEVGVEGAVTDHLRGLSQVAAKPVKGELVDDDATDLLAIAAQLQQTVVSEPTVVIESVAPERREVDASVEHATGALVPAAQGQDAGGSGGQNDDRSRDEEAAVSPSPSARPMSYSERRRLRAERREIEAAEQLAAISASEVAEEVSVARPETGAIMVTEQELASLFDDVSDSEASIEVVAEDVVADEVIADEVAAVEGAASDEESDAAVAEEASVLANADSELEDEDLEDGELADQQGELEDDEESVAEDGDDEADDEHELSLDSDDEEEDEEDEGEEEDEADEDLADDEVLAESEFLAEDEELDDGLDEADDDAADDDAADDDAADEDSGAEVAEELAEPVMAESDTHESDAQEAQAEETVVSIPRPDEAPSVAFPTPPSTPAERSAAPTRQQKLFGSGVDEELMAEATGLVSSGRRTTATLLQRKLRIDYEMAVEVLAELTNRGLLSGDEDRS